MVQNNQRFQGCCPLTPIPKPPKQRCICPPDQEDQEDHKGHKESKDHKGYKGHKDLDQPFLLLHNKEEPAQLFHLMLQVFLSWMLQ